MADKKSTKADPVAEPTATVEEKSIPALKKDADNSTFAKDYLVHLPDSSDIPENVIENAKRDVVQTANQRGLTATGEAELASSKVLDAHNVELVYTVPVKRSTEK